MAGGGGVWHKSAVGEGVKACCYAVLREGGVCNSAKTALRNMLGTPQVFHGFQLLLNLQNDVSITRYWTDVSGLMNPLFLCLRIIRHDSTVMKGLDLIKGGSLPAIRGRLPPVRNHGVEDFVNIACGANTFRLTIENVICLVLSFERTVFHNTILVQFNSQDARRCQGCCVLNFGVYLKVLDSGVIQRICEIIASFL